MDAMQVCALPMLHIYRKVSFECVMLTLYREEQKPRDEEDI